MNVIFKRSFDDLELRRIMRAVTGRQVKASRAIVRRYIGELVKNDLMKLPTVKLREKKAVREKRVADAAAMVDQAVSMVMTCRHCGKAESEHGAQGKACPVSRSYRRPTRFSR